jgi:hypothetical protein
MVHRRERFWGRDSGAAISIPPAGAAGYKVALVRE